MGLKQASVLRVPSFLRFIRDHDCAVLVRSGLAPDDLAMICLGPIEAAHVRSGTDGGTGMKPSDRYALPLCSKHHRRQHQIGEGPFEKETGVNMRPIADGLWAQWLRTDTGRRWALKTGYVANATATTQASTSADTNASPSDATRDNARPKKD